MPIKIGEKWIIRVVGLADTPPADTRKGKQRMVMQTHNKLFHQNRLFLQVVIDATDGVNTLDGPQVVSNNMLTNKPVLALLD